MRGSILGESSAYIVHERLLVSDCSGCHYGIVAVLQQIIINKVVLTDTVDGICEFVGSVLDVFLNDDEFGASLL